MRRKEKECNDMAVMEEFLKQGEVMHLAIHDPDNPNQPSGQAAPYIVPVHYVYDEGVLYFHSAMEGMKLDLIKKNPRVGFNITALYKIRQADSPCGTGTAFGSVTGSATAYLHEHKQEVLNLFTDRFTQHPHTEFPADMLAKVAVVRLAIDTIFFKVDKRGV